MRRTKTTAAHMRRYLTAYSALHATEATEQLPNHCSRDSTPHTPVLTPSSGIGKAQTGELFNADRETR